MSTRPGHIEGTISYQRNPSPESDLSTESEEDKNEEPSRLAFDDIMYPIVFHKSFQPVATQRYSHIIRQYASKPPSLLISDEANFCLATDHQPP